MSVQNVFIVLMQDLSVLISLKKASLAYLHFCFCNVLSMFFLYSPVKCPVGIKGNIYCMSESRCGGEIR